MGHGKKPFKILLLIRITLPLGSRSGAGRVIFRNSGYVLRISCLRGGIHSIKCHSSFGFV